MGHPLAYTALHIDVFSNILRHNKRMIHLVTSRSFGTVFYFQWSLDVRYISLVQHTHSLSKHILIRRVSEREREMGTQAYTLIQIALGQHTQASKQTSISHT